MFDYLARIRGASALAFGLAGATVPRRIITLAERLVLVGYENPEDLEPSELYVPAMRAKSGLVALSDVVVLALEYAAFSRSDIEESTDVADAGDRI